MPDQVGHDGGRFFAALRMTEREMPDQVGHDGVKGAGMDGRGHGKGGP